MGLLNHPPSRSPSHWYSTSGLNGTKTVWTKDNSADSGPMNAWPKKAIFFAAFLGRKMGEQKPLLPSGKLT